MENSSSFVVFPFGTLAALCTVQSASSDWLHLAADIRSLPIFPLNLELRDCKNAMVTVMMKLSIYKVTCCLLWLLCQWKCLPQRTPRSCRMLHRLHVVARCISRRCKRELFIASPSIIFYLAGSTYPLLTSAGQRSFFLSFAKVFIAASRRIRTPLSTVVRSFYCVIYAALQRFPKPRES